MRAAKVPSPAPGRSALTAGPRAGQHCTRCFRITFSVDEVVRTAGSRRIGLAVSQARPPAVHPPSSPEDREETSRWPRAANNS